MSFILDALRKSEHERQRSTIPGLSQVPVAIRQHGVPRWAVIVIGLLGAAVLVLGGAWWQSTQAPFGIVPAPVTRTDRSIELPAAPPTRAPAAPPPAIANTAPPPTSSTQRFEPPPFTPARSLSEATATEPRQASSTPTPPAGDAAVRATSETTLPSATALAAQGIVLPTLHLELHAYAERPSDRFVFINGRKYVEGDRLADGPELVEIEPKGAVLRHLGQRFLLSAE